MLEKLRRAFEYIAVSVSTTSISGEKLEELRDELVFRLVECDVAFEAAEALADSVREALEGKRYPRGVALEDVAREAITMALRDLFAKVEWFDLEEAVKRRDKPVKIVFLGPNGHGKTTTIAKLGYRFIRKGCRVVLAASDTWRAGAIEQLKKHADAIGADFIAHSYGADPAAVAYDAVAYARKRGRDLVLIDTAGRLQTDINLMDELRKIVRVVEPDYRIFVGDALTGNDALDQALKFNEMIGLDGGILTKVDADAKGGALVSFVYATRKPILYLGIGQGYEDLIPFDSERFVNFITGGEPLV